MSLREVQVGELYKAGDKMQYPFTNTIQPIPKQWIEKGFKHELVGTVGRQKIKIFREED